MLIAWIVLAHCGGNVHQQTPAELGPVCDPKTPTDCPVINECQVCVYIGTSGLCGHACKSTADCGAGSSCRKTHDYAYVGACTKWTEDVGYCAEEHAAFGKLCAKVDDCEKTASGCGICGQAKDDNAYRCRKACTAESECTAPQKCVAPPATAAYVGLAACDKPERWCQ